MSGNGNSDLCFSGMSKLYVGACLVVNIKTSPLEGLEYFFGF
jgi:hypothetical protein